MITFQVFMDESGCVAIDSEGNSGYGDTPEAAVADLQLAYDDAGFDVGEFSFTLEG